MSIILPKHFECVIKEAPKEGYFLLVNNKTGWVGGLYVDFDKRTYRTVIIFDNDKVSLGYFREFLKENGWEEE